MHNPTSRKVAPGPTIFTRHFSSLRRSRALIKALQQDRLTQDRAIQIPTRRMYNLRSVRSLQRSLSGRSRSECHCLEWKSQSPSRKSPYTTIRSFPTIDPRFVAINLCECPSPITPFGTSFPQWKDPLYSSRERCVPINKDSDEVEARPLVQWAATQAVGPAYMVVMAVSTPQVLQ